MTRATPRAPLRLIATTALAVALLTGCSTVKNLLDRYADPDVIAEAKKLASKKRGVLANLFFGYEQARSGAKDKKQYDAVRAAVAAYEMPEKSA